MTEGHDHRGGVNGTVSAAELLNRYGQSSATAHGPARRGRPRRNAMLATGGVAAAVAIGAVSLLSPESGDPRPPATVSDPDDSGDSAATAPGVPQPLPQPITGTSQAEPVSTERTGPGGPTPTPTAADAPQQAEQGEGAAPEAPATGEPPPSRPPPSQPPASQPPPEYGPLAPVLQPILG